MLQEREEKLVAEVFKELKNPVKLINFTQELECQFCRETRQLLTEVAGLSDKVSLEVYNFQLDRQKVEEYQVDKIPATVIEGGEGLWDKVLRCTGGIRVCHPAHRYSGCLQRRIQPQTGDKGRSKEDRSEGSPAGVCHPHLTLLSPGGQPGTQVCHGE